MAEIEYFARFHARPGAAPAILAALEEVTPHTRREPTCLSVAFYRSLRDPDWFYVHSRWTSEAAFDAHALEPHTVRFVETMEALIDHEWDGARVERL
jgi:quinol monooxygenase YgiN